MNHSSLVKLETISNHNEFNKNFQNNLNISTELQILNELILNSLKIQAISKRKNVELYKLLNSNDTCEALIEQSLGTEDPRIFSQLLICYLGNPRHYSSRLNALFLKRIGRLLYYLNGEYATLAIRFLQMVVDDFGEKIYMVFDEDSQTCRNALLQICFNSSFLLQRLMRFELQKAFENILKQIEKITLF